MVVVPLTMLFKVKVRRRPQMDTTQTGMNNQAIFFGTNIGSEKISTVIGYKFSFQSLCELFLRQARKGLVIFFECLLCGISSTCRTKQITRLSTYGTTLEFVRKRRDF